MQQLENIHKILDLSLNQYLISELLQTTYESCW